MNLIVTNIVRLTSVLFLVTLLACAPPGGIPVTGDDLTATAAAKPTAEEGLVLANTAWNLTSYGPEAAQTQVLEGTEVTLEFEDEAQAVGSAGCNTFGVDYSITMDFEISITDMIQTERACTEEGIMEQESQYLDALQSASLFEYTPDTLRIWYEDGQNVLRFTRTNGSVSTPTP